MGVYEYRVLGLVGCFLEKKKAFQKVLWESHKVI